MPELICHDPTYQGYQYDAEMAKMYLAQSTYKTGDNVPQLSVASRPDSNQWNLVLQSWQRSWKEILDIDFKIHLIERGGEMPADLNMLRDSWGAGIPDPGYLLNFIVHTGTAGIMHVNDELDAKLEAANLLGLDDPGRCAAFQEVDQENQSMYYYIPITAVNYQFLVQPWVLGFETSVNNDIGGLHYIKLGKKR